MRKTIISLLSKFIVLYTTAWVTFSLIDGNNLGSILILAIVATITNFVMGDLILLPAAETFMASIGNGVMGILVARMFNTTNKEFITSTTSLFIFFVAIAVFEFILYMYILKSSKFSS